jgi:tetratricopeptide (TPR) repeat protein
MSEKKKCFVVMGFGEKTDLATGRVLDLDKTYRTIIRKAVEEAGLECIRADDIKHSGLIDVPMYELLLSADIVIADLSTANPNAIYELGVRHALRPHATIIMAESQFKFPFDLSHIVIRPYEHLGKGIDAEHAEKVREELKAAIHQLLEEPNVDSPVYRFVPRLQEWGAGVAPMLKAAAAAQPLAAAAPQAAGGDDSSVSELMEMYREAQADSDWGSAVRSLKRLIERRPNELFFQQQLALATYKSKKPDPLTALLAARQILEKLGPHTTTDPETLGLWGAVHKRLFELKRDPADLDESIRAHEKGFYVKNDYYNGINLAFMLNIRAASSADPREAGADVVQAERIRRRVIGVTEALLASGIKNDDGTVDEVETFWVKATLAEAMTGSGRNEDAAKLREEILKNVPEAWMKDSITEQLQKLEGLLAKGLTQSGVWKAVPPS